ncbi:hypothetical protein GCM10009847_09480 [Leucobacter tardus]|uniref:Uncharacterized protein n=1 Tax=Leucobacter tardus TaxID=501483 RepID=A0A939QCA6_9MICO|nr:hypothetical protein [Leucobacter tardus]MBO2989146.1 hypothetical protein [Leucobacter tardus]
MHDEQAADPIAIRARRREALSGLAHGALTALIGAGICAVFVLAWTRATAAVAATDAGAYVAFPTETTDTPGRIALVLGCAVGLVLVAVGLAGVIRGALAIATATRGPARRRTTRSAPQAGGSIASHVLLGVHRRRGMLPPRLARALSTALPWVLIVAVTLATEPRMMFAAPLLAFLGSLLGRGLYAVRPAARWARPLIVTGIPVLLAAPLLLGSLRPGQWTIPVAFLLGAEIGAHLGELRERVVGARPRILAREFAGVTHAGDPRGVHFDVRPLLHTPTRAERQEFLRSAPHLSRTDDVVRVRLIGVVTALLPIGALAMGYGMVQEVLEGGEDRASQLLGMSAFLSLMLLGSGILIWWTTRQRARLTSARDHFAFAHFAEANGLDYSARPTRSPDGADTLTRTMRARDTPRELLFANRESSQSRGVGDGRTHFGGVCLLEVAAPLPNIRLRSRRHRTPAFSAYAAPARDQRLSLEGDFDRHFEMSVPRGYERDALYLFTPDVMAWLIDDVQSFDVELIDRSVVLHSRSDVVTRNPADWNRLAIALSAIRQRIVQWERWRDDRAATSPGPLLEMETRGRATTVGARGRRLRLGIGAGTIFAAAFIGVYLMLTVLANTL